MKWQSPEFEQLQDYWYELLEAEGFTDIERDPRIKSTCRPTEIPKHRRPAQDKTDYFTSVSASFESWHFKDSRPVDRYIMEWHVQGHTLDAIRNKLSLVGYKRGIPAIHFIIRQYLMLWGIKSFTPKQLNCTIEQLKAKIPRTA